LAVALATVGTAGAVAPYHLERLETHHAQIVLHAHAEPLGDPRRNLVSWVLLSSKPPANNADQCEVKRITAVNGQTVVWTDCKPEAELAPYELAVQRCDLPYDDAHRKLDVTVVTTATVYKSGLRMGRPRPEQTVALTEAERAECTKETEALDFKSPEFQAAVARSGLDKRLPGETSREVVARFYRALVRGTYYSVDESHWPKLSQAVTHATVCCESAAMITVGALRNLGVPCYVVFCDCLKPGTATHNVAGHAVVKFYDEVALNWCWLDPTVVLPPVGMAKAHALDFPAFDAAAYALTDATALYFTEGTGGWVKLPNVNGVLSSACGVMITTAHTGDGPVLLNGGDIFWSSRLLD
jgi:hypothetical protein